MSLWMGKVVTGLNYKITIACGRTVFRSQPASPGQVIWRGCSLIVTEGCKWWVGQIGVRHDIGAAHCFQEIWTQSKTAFCIMSMKTVGMKLTHTTFLFLSRLLSKY